MLKVGAQASAQQHRLQQRVRAALEVAGAPTGGEGVLAGYRRVLAGVADVAGGSAAAPEWSAVLSDGRLLRVRAPRYEAYGDALRDAREALRGALEAAGVREQRALTTGAAADVVDLQRALAAVDEAVGLLWELEAGGTVARRAAGVGHEGGPPSDAQLSLLQTAPEVSYEDAARARGREDARRRATDIKAAAKRRRRERAM